MSHPDPATDRRLAHHRRRYRELTAQIAELGFITRGSVTERFTTCGKASCRCQADPPRRHGPYWQWTTKIDGTTVTRRLTEDEAALYQQWIANRRHLDTIIAEMEHVSRDAADQLLDPPPTD